MRDTRSEAETILQRTHAIVGSIALLLVSACASVEGGRTAREGWRGATDGVWPVARSRSTDPTSSEVGIVLRRDGRYGVVAAIETVAFAEDFVGWAPDGLAGGRVVAEERRRAACAIRTCLMVERLTVALDDESLTRARGEGLRFVLRGPDGATLTASAPAAPVRTALAALAPADPRVAALH